MTNFTDYMVKVLYIVYHISIMSFHSCFFRELKLSETLLLSYPCSSPTQVRHLPQKLLRTDNIDTETNGTNTNNDEVQLYQERLL